MNILTIIGKIFSPLAYLLNSFLLKLFVLVDEPHEKILINFLIILIFAVIYFSIYKFQMEVQKKDKEKIYYSPYSSDTLNFFDALYFSFVVHFTLGFGDVFPVSTLSRVMVMIHTTLFWLINLIDAELIAKITQYFKNSTISPVQIYVS
jgi:uncharacterized membrane protein